VKVALTRIATPLFALGLVAVVGCGRAREAGQTVDNPRESGALRGLGDPDARMQPSAPIPVRDPSEPAVAALTSAAMEMAPKSGVPVLDSASVLPGIEGATIVVCPAQAPESAAAPEVMPPAHAIVVAPVMAALPATPPTTMAPAALPWPRMPTADVVDPAPEVAAAPTWIVPDRAGAGAPNSSRAPEGPRPPIVEDLGPAPAAALDPRPFAEAHWQGLEAIPKTTMIAAALKLPADIQGVILDDVTLPADLEGFRAGDLVIAVDGVPTPNLVSFIRASDRVRNQKRVPVDFVRAGAPHRLDLVALLERLGTANGETPPMIPPGARRPHRYMGPCLNCHRIGTTGNLAADQGDNLKNAPGPVRVTDKPLHRDRGACAACHPILP
jgi:hypothetical protein